MKLRKAEIISLGLILLSFAAAFYFYPQLPERIASHWNANGEVDGFMSAFWGVFLFPIILLFLYLLFLIVPRIDPKHENIEKFRAYFDGFIISIFLFMGYLYGLTLAWNLGYTFNLMKFLSPAFAVLFFVIGILLSHTEPNWTIGIRTPWTLSNPEVWQKTHHLGGSLFKISALIAFFGIFFPDRAIWLVLVPVIISALTAGIYSYIEYRKIGKK